MMSIGDHNMASIRLSQTRTKEDLRSFGLQMALILGLIAGWVMYQNKASWLLWVTLTFLFGISALLAPSILRPIDKFWMKLGEWLGMIMTPVIMGVLFYGVITPIGLIMRALGKDLIDQKLDKSAKSYWIKATKTEDQSRYFTPY
jgi:hypothetical protein